MLSQVRVTLVPLALVPDKTPKETLQSVTCPSVKKISQEN